MLRSIPVRGVQFFRCGDAAGGRGAGLARRRGQGRPPDTQRAEARRPSGNGPRRCTARSARAATAPAAQGDAATCDPGPRWPALCLPGAPARELLGRRARQYRDAPHRVPRRQCTRPQAWVDLAAWLNALPVASFEVTGDGRSRSGLGRGIFHEAMRVLPSGRTPGATRPGFVPSLRNQHYSYLASQMHKLGWKARGTTRTRTSCASSAASRSRTSPPSPITCRACAVPGVERKHMRDDGVVID